MSKWRIKGMRGVDETGFDREVTGGEQQVRLLLERLACRHLTDDEITDTTLGRRNDLRIEWMTGGKSKSLMTWGSDYHYIATYLA